MIAERYISRTNVRKHNRSKNAEQVLEKLRKMDSTRNTSKLSTKNSKSMKSARAFKTKLMNTFNPKTE